jgi:hypothetical protein
MPDLLTEQKAALEKQTRRVYREQQARRGIPAGSAATGLNPFGGRADAVQLEGFGTGYNGTETTLAFTWGVSVWGGSDLWTGS